MDVDQIQRNIDAAHAAEAVAELACDESQSLPEANRERFWRLVGEKLARWLPRAEPQVVRDKPMTDDESRKFGQRAIEFGRYACQPVESVPLDYLLWLDEQPDFRRDLNKYLRSDRIQQEQG
jgi:hypothetical protein